MDFILVVTVIIVIRSAGRFAEDEFLRHVGKAVREGHVTTDDHWSRTWIPNTLARPRHEGLRSMR